MSDSPLTDDAEARTILTEEAAGLKSLDYETVSARVRGRTILGVQFAAHEPELVERTGASGIRYQVKLDYFWDRRRRGDVRVVVEVLEESDVSKSLIESFVVAHPG